MIPGSRTSTFLWHAATVRMAAVGYKRTFRDVFSNVRLWGKSGHRGFSELGE